MPMMSMKAAYRGLVRISLLSALACPAWPASFPCESWVTGIERMICDDEVLSELDDSLAAAYRTYRDSAADPVAFIRGQKKWVAEKQSRCRTRECLEKAYRARIPEMREVKKMTVRKYVSRALKIEFDLPSNRRVIEDKKGGWLDITGPAKRKDESYFHVIVYNGDFEKTASNSAGEFEKREGRWYPVCDENYPPAEPWSGNGWSGYKASYACDIHDGRPYDAPKAVLFSALIGNGKRYLSASSLDDLEDDPVDLGILASIRFLD